MVAARTRKKKVKSRRKVSKTKKKTVPKRAKPAKKPKKPKKTKKKKKVVFIVVDGLADALKDGKTPLSEAKKPTIDWLAENGSVGEAMLITKTLWKEIDARGVSQYGNTSLLGLNPAKYPLDRGPLEAVGVKIPFKDGHLAVRCNFATVDRNMRITDRRAGRSTYGLDMIGRRINKSVKLDERFVFMRTYGHRAVLVIKKKLSPEIEGNDTPVGQRVGRVTALVPEAEESARLVQDFIDKARNVIHFHTKNSERIDKGLPPANYLLVRQPGNSIPKFPNFPKKWKLNKALCISENGVMKATCMLAGFNSINVPEFSDHTEWLDFIFDNVETALSEYDFVYIHIKGADQAAHDKDPKRKREVIEDIDRHLEPYRNFDGVIVITCDHITSSLSGDHEYGPVPVLLYGRGKDSVKTFDEQIAKKGALGRMTGRELLKHVFGK
jgi:2,3-bisphosphoglycerate-independent phosphoglycerate mutase